MVLHDFSGTRFKWMAAEFRPFLLLALKNGGDGKFSKRVELQTAHLTFYFGLNERYLEIAMMYRQLLIQHGFELHRSACT